MTPSQAYFLGIDGGATNCRAVLAGTEQGVVGAGRSGGCNPHTAGHRRAVRALAEAISRACIALPQGQRLTAAAFGLAGTDSPRGMEEGRQLAFAALAEAGVEAETLLVENDGFIAFRGAVGQGRGVLIAAGTGSVIYAGDGAKFARAGGWGHRVGDVGSAHQIASAALAAAFQCLDGLPVETDLGRCLCEQAGVGQLLDLLDWLYAPERREDDVASLAPAVDRAAADGDPEARRILAGAGRDLADLAAAAARRAGLTEGEAFPVYLAGSVLQRSESVRRALLERLLACCPGAQPDLASHQPVFGALLLAMEAADAVDEALLERLQESPVLRA